MAQGKLTGREEMTETAPDDLVHVVDVSDNSQDNAGSSYKAKLSNLLPNTGIEAGSYGSTTVIPRITFNAKGQATAIEQVEIGGTYASAERGELAYTALQPEDIGDTVQPYDPATAKTDEAQTYTRQQATAAATLTDGASIAWNLNDAQAAKVTLGGNRTLANPTNIVDGGTYTLIVKQDATGGRTLAFGDAYIWPDGIPPTLSTAPGARDVLGFLADGTEMLGSYIQSY